MHGTTYGGNPLACAVANAVLSAIESEGLEANTYERGEQLVAGMASLAEAYPSVIAGHRGMGLMQGLVLQEAGGIPGMDGEAAPNGQVHACTHSPPHTHSRIHARVARVLHVGHSLIARSIAL